MSRVTTAGWLVAMASLVSTTLVRAEPRPNLTLAHDPGLHHLRMRPRAAQASLPASAAAVRHSVMPLPPPHTPTPTSRIAELDGIRNVLQPVSFSLNVGYQIDGARPSGRDRVDGGTPQAGSDYATLRSYGFGEGYASTRGVGLASLSTYFSARFEAARRIRARDPVTDQETTAALPPPIATWFDRSGTDLRTGWAELRDFLPRRWGLQRLRVRAGDQFIYGAWSMHVLGANVAYDGDTLQASVFSGVRRSDYTRAVATAQPTAFGGTLRFDLRGLARPLPIAVGASFLRLSDSDDTGQPATSSTLLQADWRPRRWVAVIAQARLLGSNSANQRLEVRARYKEVSNLVFDITHREQDDWRWDPTLVVLRQDDITEARRYLDLGPVLPQLIASVRGGTLIAENVDLYARIAGAADLRGRTMPASSYSASYLELAGALEVRLRRQVAVGLSALSRQTSRTLPHSVEDHAGVADPLPGETAIGEEGFTEVGSTLRMSLGARKFSAVLEVYGRRTHFGATYHDPMALIPNSEVRGGGRFTVDAWLGPRVRLFAAYDASSELDTAPEINGYKSLRLIMSGVY